MWYDLQPFSDTLTFGQMAMRIGLAVILSGIIGYERGRKRNVPAGFRTHILVCVGAASVSLLEDQLRVELIKFAGAHQDLAQFFKSDISRLGAQVITGIGFLGAGTIIRDKATVGGLTTAASLWATGCLGLIIGWGFYTLAILSGLTIFLVLVVLKSFESVVLPKPKKIKLFSKPYNSLRIEFSFVKDNKYDGYIEDLYVVFEELGIRVKEFNRNSEEHKAYYRLHFDKELSSAEVLKRFSQQKYITSFSCY